MTPPTTILVYVGLDAVGDGLMKLPFLRALRTAFPDAKITWMAGKGHTVYAGSLAPLVAGLVDEVLDQANVGSKTSELLRRPLSGRRFDLVIDTQRRVLTTAILTRIRHGRFLSASANFLFSDIKPRSGWTKKPAMVAQLMDLVELASGRPAQATAPLPRDPAAEAAADTLLPPDRRYAGFAPGAGGKHKCWPLERFLDLAARLDARGLAPLFLLGPAEGEWGEAIRSALPGAMLPLQSGGEVTPMLTIALGRRLAVAVANDSGTGHMLAAADAPLASLFGPTPAEKFAPAASRLAVVRAQEFGGTDDMAAIPVDAVEQACARLLSQ